ncbi:Cerebellar degeneration-related protein 2-like [Melipona quadrifasciata]|uniref:Cerebellar degeneration-related protein 2-like n=1 Tax=Melipona quadrifasciata TaxID=166423 RepID=A0A0N0BE68_9HYME|nr:Cerebellar degeneration-related protein 2-like [Melipona quadrifasciata]
MSGPSVDVVWDPQTQMNSLDCWDYSIELACLQNPEDLQLAAELGKTLLERNKELENIIKTHQSTVEEQAQEIEYMKKQTAALREVNDSRLKIYEQLEVSIQDLERANHRLVIENTGDKKLIKSQCLTIESLEGRCEELQKKIDEINEQHESLLRQQTASQSTNTAQTQTFLWKVPVTQGGSIQQSAAPSGQKPFQESTTDSNVRQFHSTISTNDEEITELMRQLQETRSQRAREQKKVTELGQQLATLLQENNALEEQLNVLRNKAQDVKNLQEEINTLEEVRRGQLCGRCLRGMESKTHDELSVMLNQEEYDDISMAESLINDNQHDTESVTQNPYRVLVEKYQALLEVQRLSALRRKDSVPTPMSLQEELEMSGEFNSFQNPTSETESQQEPAKSAGGNGTRAKAETCDDNQSIASSMFSSAVSEPPYRVQRPVSSNGINEQENNETVATAQVKTRNDIIRDTNRTDYIAFNYKKKLSKKHTNRKLTYNDRPTTPDIIPTTNPKFVPSKSNSGGKKKYRTFAAADQNNGSICNGYSYANKTKELPNPGKHSNNVHQRNSNDQHNNSFEYRDYKPSTASEEVARLKRLEMSYAEVLRLPNKSKMVNHRRS